MYTRADNPPHIAQEAIDIAADEALAALGKRINVTLHTEGSVSIDDDGRGIPFGLYPEEGVSVLEIVFTRLHAGGKFDKGSGGAYSFSGGQEAALAFGGARKSALPMPNATMQPTKEVAGDPGAGSIGWVASRLLRGRTGR
jgi:hypothetical protein